MSSLVARLKKFADRPWYAPLIAFLAGLDQFILVLPIEWLMIPGILVRPRRWFSTALLTTSGSALGALALAALAKIYGPSFIALHLPDLMISPRWVQFTGYIEAHGYPALAAIAASPFPQQPGVAIAGLSKMSLPVIFAAVWTGRAIKYLFVSWVASHAPRLLAKLPGGKKLVQELPFPQKAEIRRNVSRSH